MVNQVSELSALKNIGKATEKWLNNIGVYTRQDLEDIGVTLIYKVLKFNYPSKITPNLLYALQGAVDDINWQELPEDVRDQLKLSAAA